jgi:hypothetical protein
MSDSTQVLSPEHGSDAGAYRPLSPPAVAGFALGATYAAVVVVLGAVALLKRSPLFLPAWTFLVPVAAVALGWVGRVQVRRSEGTRSGSALADWGIRLGLVVGLGYTAFYIGIYLAVVRIEAQGFTRQWLGNIRSGEQVSLYTAFKNIQDPAKRQADDPSNPVMMKVRYGMRGRNGSKSVLQQFEENDFVRALRDGGAECTFECLGVREWDFSAGGYKVGQTYRITTPEGRFEAQIDVLGTEGKEFKGRQWRVVWSDRADLVKPLHLTDLGQALRAWQENAPEFVGRWLVGRADPSSLATYLATLGSPERERAVGRLALAAVANLGTGPEGLAPPALAVRLLPLSDSKAAQDVFLPGHRDFAAARLIRADRPEFQAPEDIRDEVIKLVTENFHNPEVCGIRPMGVPYIYVSDRERGRVRVNVDVDIGLRPGASALAMTPKYTCGGYVTIESGPGPLRPDRAPDWRVVGLRLTHAMPKLSGQEMQDMSRGGMNRMFRGTPQEVQDQMRQEMQERMRQGLQREGARQ